MHVKKGDLVKIIAGKDRQLGPSRVIEVLPAQNRVVVEGRNLVKKHIKGTQFNGGESRIEETEAPIHASNVLLWSEKISKPVRTQMRFVGMNGELFGDRKAAADSFPEPPLRVKKVRYSPKSDEIFD